MADVLLVGGERDRTAGIRSLLLKDGHHVAHVPEVLRWREEERKRSPEVVVAAVATSEPLLSVPMGGLRGFAAPLLIVHGESDESAERYIEERLVDRISSPFAAEDLLGRVDALVRVRRVVLRKDRAIEADVQGPAPSGRFARFARALTSVLAARVPRYAKPAMPYLEVAARVADWSDRRDGFEPGHAERVTSYAAMIADELGLGDGEAAGLLRAAMLHDIGKVALPIEVLRQKAPLEEQQMRLLRTHTERGAAILRALDDDHDVAETILYHHEHVDGSGYYGKQRDAIPRAARILAVAESYDAMATSLVRKTLSRDAAMGLLRERRGGQWDAECVDALVDAVRPRPRTIALS